MPSTSLSDRIINIILHQKGEDDPEIRTLSLATLNDSKLLSIAALLWTQIGWSWALATAGWLWVLGLVAVDVALFLLRWGMRNRWTRMKVRLDAASASLAVVVNLGLTALVAIDVLVLTQVPSDRATILAIILTIGFLGYVVAIFSAFEVLATINILVLTGAATLGLAIGHSDLARPFALLIPGGTIAFLLLMRRTHVVLLGSIRSQRKNRLLSLHDPLTKLPNRAFLQDALARQLSAIGTQNGSDEVAILCLDLDGFKAINDRFGHAAGDWVLVHVADILRRCLAVGEQACRIGGDEYVLLLPGGGETRVKSLGRSVIEAVSEPFDIGHTIPARIGVSIGAAVAQEQGYPLGDLLGEADGALYAAKRAGRGRLHLHRRAA